MEVAEEGSSDSEEVVFFNSKQKESVVERQKLKEEDLASSKKGAVVCRSKSNGRKNYPMCVNPPTQRKQMENQSLKNYEIDRKAENSEKSSSLKAFGESLLDDSLEFAKRFNADVNFVHAKFAARKQRP